MLVKFSSYIKSLQLRWLNLEVHRQGAAIVGIPIACLVSSLLAIAWLRYTNIQTRIQIEQTQQIVREINRLLGILVDAETSIGNYGLSQRTEFIKSYSDAKTLAVKSSENLGSLLKNNSEIKTIQKNLKTQLNLLEKTRQKIDRLEAESQVSFKLSDQIVQNKLKMDSLRQQIARFSAEEEGRLQQLSQKADRRRTLITNFQWFALIFGLLGGWVAWQLSKCLELQLQRKEASLQESKTRIQAVVDNAADAIITLDELGNIESFNPAAEQIFGYQSASVIGANFRKLIAERFREDTTSDALNYFVRTPSAKLCTCGRETVGRRSNGTTFPMDLAISQMQLAADRLFIAICRDITERRKADEMLHNQAQLLDLANDSIIVLNLTDNITYWNQGAKRLYGWKRKEAIGQNIYSLLRTEFPYPLPDIQQELQQQGYWEGEVIQAKKDGTKIRVASRWTLQRDVLRQPVAILQINNDITQRQEAQQALLQSQQMLQWVMDNIPQFIYWKDIQGVYLGCNHNVAKLMGLESPAEIVGLTDYELPFSQEQAERYGAQDLQVMQTNLPKYHNVELLWLDRPQKKSIWVNANKIPLTDASGQVVGMLGTFEDITERKRSESARMESEQRFRATFEQAAVGMAQTTLDGQWLMVNQKLCDIVGYSREELLERKFQEITHPVDRETEIELLGQLQVGEIEMYSMQKRLIRKDGLPVWVNLTVSLLRPPEGKQSLMKVVEDISDRKIAEEALKTRAEELARTTAILAKTTTVLKKRNQELDQFAYVVSHDLKAPLRAIANLSTWIEEDLEDILTQDTKHQMNLLRGRVHRMESLIEGLLQYSRVGRLKTSLERVNVDQLLADVVDSLAPAPEFSVEIGPGMPTLFTDRLLIGQVFSNLIGNAIKHNPRQSGCVQITLNDRGEFYEFAVADDGPGIAPEYHEKVFAIFSTLEARDKVENTGIGLSLVKKIVETQGGSIHLESQEGQGAIFRFTWPKSLNS